MIHASEIHGPAARRAQDYLVAWQRERAEFDNFRKRQEEGHAQRAEAQLRVILDPILSLNDNFRAMIKHAPPELNDHAWVTGVVHVGRQLQDTLIGLGVSVIDGSGRQFDPALHEAIDQASDSKAQSGTIIEVLQAGYQLKDTVLRPAKVKVAE